MKRMVATMLGIMGLAIVGASGSVILSDFDPIAIDFAGFTAPDPWSNDGGTGGALNWNTWAFSSGTRTEVAADFGTSTGTGRGTSTGGVTDNGIYAFEVAPGLNAWGFQATGGFGSPGSLTLRVQNNTGGVLKEISVAYTAWYYNDEPRAGVLRPYYSLTNDGTSGSYLQADGSNQDVNSPADADDPPVWVSNDRGYTLTDLDVAQGDFVYLRWGFNDSGSGRRDEWALSSITVTAIPEPGTFGLLALSGLALARFRRR